jgi:hypothetical protein
VCEARPDRTGSDRQPALSAEQEHLRERQGVGMCNGQQRRLGTQGGESAGCAPMKPQLRGTALPDHFDAAPQHLLCVTGPKRLHGRLFRGKAACEMNRGVVSAHAVGDFALGEYTLQEPIAEALDGCGNTGDIGRIEAQTDDVRHD